MANFMTTVKEKCAKAWGFVKDKWSKLVAWVEKIIARVNWKIVWDKTTTGILILLICSPILILGYIFLWFIFK